MKKNQFSFLLICMFAGNFASAQFQEYDPQKGSNLSTKKGMNYTYEVDFFGNKYDFIVSVTEKSPEKGLSFDYKMTNTKNTSGKVYMSAEALNSARVQNNYFSGGDMKLNDMTTVWISKTVYEELATKGESKISTDGGSTWVALKRVHYNYDFPVKTGAEVQNHFAYMYCEGSDGKAKFWIQTGNNPLILKMDLGWSITLKEFAIAEK